MPAPTRRRPPLGVSLLEPRLAPAGVVTASLAGGLLTLTGDDTANSVTIKVTGTAVTLTPDSSTAIDDLGKPGSGIPGVAITINGTATTLAADLKGGADFLLADSAADLVLPGGVTAQLGDGANHLHLVTSGKIDLGRLVVTAGDGLDNVDVAGGVGLGSRVVGLATLDLGPGDSHTFLDNLAIPGPTGLRVTDGRTGTISSLTGTSLIVAGTVRTAIGGTGSGVRFTGGTLGGLAVAGRGAAVSLDGVTVAGPVTVRAQADAALTPGPGATKVGRVSVVGGGSATVEMPGALTAGNVTVRAGNTATLNAEVGLTAGVVSVTGTHQAELDAQAGTFAAASVALRTAGLAFVQANGAAVHIAGALTVVGGFQTSVSFFPTSPSDIGGNLTVTGGPGNDNFGIGGPFKAGGNVTLSLGGGPNEVEIGDGSPTAVPISGSLTVRTGGGDDQVVLDGATVGGPTRITTGAGADLFQADSVTFNGSFFADLGGGDDAIAIASHRLSSDPVTFHGPASIGAGAGDDTLILGASAAANGDANSRAVFQAGGKIDGGTGLNLFDGLTPDPSPAVFTGLSVGNFLHWTDPHP